MRVVNAGMERAIRRISVERGHDPRDYALVAFGGAAGMHACELAAGARHAPGAGAAAPRPAVGVGGRRRPTCGATTCRPCACIDPSRRQLARRLAPLTRAPARELRAEGRASARGRVTAAPRRALRRPVVRDPRADAAALPRRLSRRASPRFYGYADEDRPVEVVNLRVDRHRRAAPARAVAPARAAASGRAERPAPRALERPLAAARGAATARPCRAGAPRRGPLVITEFSATTFVPPGWRCAALRAAICSSERSSREPVGDWRGPER